jgi:ParB/RepB/Spo0J family partition protein
MEKVVYQQGLGMYFDVNDIYEDAIKVSKIRSEKSMEQESYKEKYKAMKETIRDQGQFAPIILRVLTGPEKKENDIDKNDIAYGVLSGHTRLKAIRELKINTVLAIVSDVQNDDDDIKTAAIENFARANMTGEDKKSVVDWFRKQTNKTTGKPYKIREIGKILGISKSYVSKLELLTSNDSQEKQETPQLTIEEIEKKFTPTFVSMVNNPDATKEEKEKVVEDLRNFKKSISSKIKELEESIKDVKKLKRKEKANAKAKKNKTK